MSSPDLSSFNNEGYNTGAGPVKRLLWYFVNALIFNSYLFPISAFKIALLRSFGANIGGGTVIKPAVNIKYPWFLSIGNYVWIGERVWIDNLTRVNIGNNVCISQGAMLLTGSHNYKKSTFDLITGPIVLEDGVWICAQSTVCPSVTCKTDAVLLTGSVATHDLEANYVYFGIPAQKMRPRNQSSVI